MDKTGVTGVNIRRQLVHKHIVDGLRSIILCRTTVLPLTLSVPKTGIPWVTHHLYLICICVTTTQVTFHFFLVIRLRRTTGPRGSDRSVQSDSWLPPPRGPSRPAPFRTFRCTTSLHLRIPSGLVPKVNFALPFRDLLVFVSILPNIYTYEIFIQCKDRQTFKIIRLIGRIREYRVHQRNYILFKEVGLLIRNLIF